MFAEHRPPDPDSTSEPGAQDPRVDPSNAARSRPSAPTGADRRSDLDRRIERTRLRVQVAALRRALAESERHRQAVVDQYELVLDEREADTAGEREADTAGERDGDGPDPHERPLLVRVLDRLRR